MLSNCWRAHSWQELELRFGSGFGACVLHIALRLNATIFSLSIISVCLPIIVVSLLIMRFHCWSDDLTDQWSLLIWNQVYMKDLRSRQSPRQLNRKLVMALCYQAESAPHQRQNEGGSLDLGCALFSVKDLIQLCQDLIWLGVVLLVTSCNQFSFSSFHEKPMEPDPNWMLYRKEKK